MIRRIAFISGLVLGSSLCAWGIGSVLIYLFTGKLPSIRAGGKLKLVLLDVQGLVERPSLISVPAETVGREA